MNNLHNKLNFNLCGENESITIARKSIEISTISKITWFGSEMLESVENIGFHFVLHAKNFTISASKMLTFFIRMSPVDTELLFIILCNIIALHRNTNIFSYGNQVI